MEILEKRTRTSNFSFHNFNNEVFHIIIIYQAKSHIGMGTVSSSTHIEK